MVSPAAKHRVGDVHATPPRAESRPAGTGMACSFQVVPLRTSVKPVTVGRELGPAVYREPTATQLVADAHETPVNDGAPVPRFVQYPASGVRRIAHREPF